MFPDLVDLAPPEIHLPVNSRIESGKIQLQDLREPRLVLVVSHDHRLHRRRVHAWPSFFLICVSPGNSINDALVSCQEIFLVINNYLC